VWDLTHTKAPIFSVQAHQSIVNDMDGFGGRVRLGAAAVNTSAFT
jgi:hypothetical protein